MATVRDDVDDTHVQRALKQALAPDGPPALDRDLWPRMRARLEAPAAAPPLADWALVAAIAGVWIAFPRLILGALYHL